MYITCYITKNPTKVDDIDAMVTHVLRNAEAAKARLHKRDKHMVPAKASAVNECCANKLLGCMQLSAPQVGNYILKGPNADRLTNCEFAVLYYGNCVPRHAAHETAEDEKAKCDDDMQMLTEENEKSHRIIGSNVYERYLHRDRRLQSFSLYDYVMWLKSYRFPRGRTADICDTDCIVYAEDSCESDNTLEPPTCTCAIEG